MAWGNVFQPMILESGSPCSPLPQRLHISNLSTIDDAPHLPIGSTPTFALLEFFPERGLRHSTDTMLPTYTEDHPKFTSSSASQHNLSAPNTMRRVHVCESLSS